MTEKFTFEFRFKNLSNEIALKLMKYFKVIGCKVVSEREEGEYHIITYEISNS